MKIGIIGLGVVGLAIKKGFEDLNHQIFVHDIKLNSQLKDILDTELVFISVPTNSNENGSIDMSIVDQVINDLDLMKYSGLICLKSTSEPGSSKKYIQKYSNLKICFVPEFLRERCAYEDFTKNHDLLLVGTNNKNYYNIVLTAHGKFPKEKSMCDPTEAELVKYFSNSYNATRVIFANYFYEISKKLDVNYENILANYLKRTHNPGDYLGCNKDLRGYGGVCLPKDTRAINFFAKKLEIDLKLMESIIEDNSKIKTTVFKGMRLT